MPSNLTKGHAEDHTIIHQYYMNIINCVPDILYWIDVDCNLSGCNNNFVNLLGLHELKDFSGTPYQQMKKFAHWPDERINAMKLDDMKAIFTGKAQFNIEEKPIRDHLSHTLYFKATRVPMFDDAKNITGLIVVLTDISALKGLERQPDSSPAIGNIADNAVALDHLPNVLMIEDNLIAQNVEKALLTALNCQVDIADSGDKALQLFGPGKYDLVLMDIGLQDTSGYAVAKQLRKMEKDTQYHVPIIALTGFEADIVKHDCKQYFMEGAITKPLTSEQADQIIKHYVYHMDVPVNGLKSST